MTWGSRDIDGKIAKAATSPKKQTKAVKEAADKLFSETGYSANNPIYGKISLYNYVPDKKVISKALRG